MRHPPDIPEKYESDYGNIGRLLCTKVAQLRQGLSAGISALKPNILTLKTPVNLPKPSNITTPTTPTTPVQGPKTPLLIVSSVPTTPTSPAMKTFTVPSSVVVSVPTISGIQSPTVPKKT